MDAADPDWQETCRRIIECLSSLWGGKYSLIIPTDGKTISPPFWHLLEAYDPDYIVRYHKTARDIMLARPDEYRRMRDAYAKHVFGDAAILEVEVDKREESLLGEVNKTGDAVLSKAEFDRWEKDFLDAAFGTFGISLELEDEIKRRLAPFFHKQYVARSSLRAHGQAQYPFTDVSVILPQCPQADRVALLDATAIGVPPLWIEAVAGALHPAQERRLAENGVRKVP